MRNLFFLCLFLVPQFNTSAKNTIIPNKGANDPHIRIIEGKAYLLASHDKSIDNKKFIMEDWWLWSSDDLVNWKLEYVLKPEKYTLENLSRVDGPPTLLKEKVVI